MASNVMTEAFGKNFLGQSPTWFKWAIVGFLILNPIVVMVNEFLAGWVLIGEFIFCLAMALKCYPLQPGGLLAIEAVALGMTSAESVYHYVAHVHGCRNILLKRAFTFYVYKDFAGREIEDNALPAVFIRCRVAVRVLRCTHSYSRCDHRRRRFLSYLS